MASALEGPDGEHRICVHGRWTHTAAAGRWSPCVRMVRSRSGVWLPIRHRCGCVGSLLGWTPNELRGLLPGALLHPDDEERLEHVGARAVVGAFVPVELRILARDGRYWSTSWHLVAGPAGALRLYGVDYLGTQEAGVPVATWRWNVLRDVVTWSAELLDMFGQLIGPPSSLAGFLANIHRDDRANVSEQLHVAATQRSPVAYWFRSPISPTRDRCFFASGRSYLEPDGSRVVAGLVKYLNAPPRAATPRIIGLG